MSNEPAIPGAPAPSSAYSPFTDQPSSNLPMGIVVGLLAAAVGAGAWAAITLLTGYKLGLVAIGVGALVGLAVRKFGKGTTPLYGVIGALLAAGGCAAGNVLSIVGFAATEQAMPFLAVLSQLDMNVAASIVVSTFEPMDGLFYAIAVYEGYKLATLKPPAAAPSA